MSLKNIKDLEYIEDKLYEIRDVLHPEDAATIFNEIIICFGDELLEDHIKSMLKAMGYSKNVLSQVCSIIKKISAKK